MRGWRDGEDGRDEEYELELGEGWFGKDRQDSARLGGRSRMDPPPCKYAQHPRIHTVLQVG